MKITKRQLRRIIKEELARTLYEGTLTFRRDRMYGGMSVYDANDDYITIGEMVLDLIESGDTDFFRSSQGVDEQALEKLVRKHEEMYHEDLDGMKRWDPDVFPEYYDVDLDRVLRLYARLKNLKLEEIEDEDDGEYDFEGYYS